MTIPDVVGIPIKPFGVAKARLAPILDAAQRSAVGKAIAANTARAVAASGAVPSIVTSDPGVAAWATDHGWGVIAEPPGGGLDGAAAATVVEAAGGTWAVVHADLPSVDTADFTAVWRTLGAGGVIAPSRDGGTSVIAAHAPLRFAYGPESFHRHRRLLPEAAVVTRPGLALDLDTAADLLLALELPGGAWLKSAVGRPVAPSC